jgi:hypothetical protein
MTDFDPCAFDNEAYVREDHPIEFRFYRDFDFRQVACTLYEHKQVFGEIPLPKRKLVERVRTSIAAEGMRNPLIIEWYPKAHPVKSDFPRWLCTIGNNRYVALDDLGVKGCEALVLFPTRPTVANPGNPTPLSGDYEVLRPLAALARFDATYPWWNSHALRAVFPSLVPKCV